MNDERIVRIESKIAFLEHTVDELNEVILAMRDQLDRVEKQLAETREQLASRNGDDLDTSFRRPPHY